MRQLAAAMLIPIAMHTPQAALADQLLTQLEEQLTQGGIQPATLIAYLEARPQPPVTLPAQQHRIPPARRSYTGGVEQWRTLVASYFPADQVDTAMRVMACESGGNPLAKNPASSAAGLFQFLQGTWDWVAGELGLPSYVQGGPYEPEAAIQAAAWLSTPAPGRGWQHWVCY